jgi:hypothetical protein
MSDYAAWGLIALGCVDIFVIVAITCCLIMFGGRDGK